jgi:hypothetical protein
MRSVVKLVLTKLLLAAALITSGVIATAILAGPAAPAESKPRPAPTAVFAELFTSEGCSSCPPADRLLESLDKQPVANVELILLSEHVDYWNYLGWQDPYSSPLFSARQQKYSERLGASVYTPQMVIDGQIQALGSDRDEVLKAIAKAAQSPKLPMSVQAGSSIHVEANSGGANAELYIVLAANHARSQVLRGENGGHVLTHVAVAESITRIGKWEGSGPAARDFAIPPVSKQHVPAALPGETRVIAILADPRTGRILGAAQTKL